MAKQLEDAMEAIGQSVYEWLNPKNEEFENSPEEHQLATKLLDLIPNAYILVKWPESQNLMELEWFREESIPNIDASGEYLIPIARAMEL